jgi:hypothetical protein
VRCFSRPHAACVDMPGAVRAASAARTAVCVSERLMPVVPASGLCNL